MKIFLFSAHARETIAKVSCKKSILSCPCACPSPCPDFKSLLELSYLLFSGTGTHTGTGTKNFDFCNCLTGT